MYFVLGLPRSRTTWLSVLLSFGKSLCYHEKSMEFPTLEALKEFCDQHPGAGISDTALLVHWKWIRQNLPDAKMVIIERDIHEVALSLEELGFPTYSLPLLKEKLEEAKADPNIMFIDFSDLNKEVTCKLIYEYCKEEPFDSSRWNELRGIEIQPNMAHLLSEMIKNKNNISSLYWNKLC